MTFAVMISHMIAACRGAGDGVAACFAPDGVYHDVFYGSFRGRPEISHMIEEHFHRDSKVLRWDIHAPVETGGTGYARYVFSYRSRLEGCEGRRAVFEGVAICRLLCRAPGSRADGARRGGGAPRRGEPELPDRVTSVPQAYRKRMTRVPTASRNRRRTGQGVTITLPRGRPVSWCRCAAAVSANGNRLSMRCRRRPSSRHFWTKPAAVSLAGSGTSKMASPGSRCCGT